MEHLDLSKRRNPLGAMQVQDLAAVLVVTGLGPHLADGDLLRELNLMCNELPDRAPRGLGRVLLRRGRGGNAASRFETAESLFQRVGDDLGRALVWTEQAAISETEERWADALALLDRIADTEFRQRAWHNWSITRKMSARILRKSGHPDQADQLLTEARAHLATLGLAHLIPDD
jgi:hypothetical protein